MECKAEKKNSRCGKSWRFNRYIVECKGKELRIYKMSKKGFNRYIVECKGRQGMTAEELNRVLIDT